MIELINPEQKVTEEHDIPYEIELTPLEVKINELIEASNRHEEELKRLRGGASYGKLEREDI